MGAEDLAPRTVQEVQASGDLAALLAQMRLRWLDEHDTKRTQDHIDFLEPRMATTTIEGLAACVAAGSSSTFDLRLLAPELVNCVEQVKLLVGAADFQLLKSMQELRDELRKGFQGAGKNEEEIGVRVSKGYTIRPQFM